MRIYFIDADNLKIEFRDFKNIFNFESFFNELDMLYPDGWYDNISDAECILHDISCLKWMKYTNFIAS